MDAVSASVTQVKGCVEVVSLLSWAVFHDKTNLCLLPIAIYFSAPKILHCLRNLSMAWDQATMLHVLASDSPPCASNGTASWYDVLHRVEALIMNTYSTTLIDDCCYSQYTHPVFRPRHHRYNQTRRELFSHNFLGQPVTVYTRLSPRSRHGFKVCFSARERSAQRSW